MGQNQIKFFQQQMANALEQNDQNLLLQIEKSVQTIVGQKKTDLIQKIQQIFKKKPNQKEISEKIDMIIEENQVYKQNKSENIKIFEDQILWINKIEQKICKSIIQLTSTKKLYHIRQNFRKLTLSVLNLENIQFYVFHDSGKTQFHDFKENYITQILQSNDKRKLLQMALANASGTIQTIQLEKSLIFSKLFSFPKSDQQKCKHIGQINKANQKYSVLVLYTFCQDNKNAVINDKIFEKIVKISMIEIQQETEYDIIQFYSTQFLNILGVIVNQSEGKMKKLMKQESEQKSFIQIMKNVSKLENNQNIIVQSLKYQQFRYQLLERIRMYNKYLCEDNIVFMDFDQSGNLNFLANNKKSSDINMTLSKLILTDDLCIQKIFSDNSKLQSHIKKAISGLSKNKKMYQIESGTKVRVIQNEQDQISRIQILIEDPIIPSQGSCSSSTLGGLSSKKKKSTNSDSSSLGKQKRSSTSLINSIQRQNPGIMDDGWLNLFIRDHQVKRKGNVMTKKKRTLFAKGQQSENLVSSQKGINLDEIQLLNQINIYSGDTNLLLLEQDHLQPFVKKVFSEIKYLKSIEYNKDYFDNFVFDVHQGYEIHRNPFHNFTHGANVMHTCFLISSLQKNQDILTPLKLFSTVFSGLCHDVGHTGRTNSFQIASKSKKAQTYNDLSPLQNFHASFAFEILRRPENNFLQKLSAEDYNQFRKDVVSNILYTDIKEHFPLIKKFKSVQYKPEQGKIMSNEDIRVLTGMITHTSDFGGSAKQFQICKQWSRRVNLQFSAQYMQQSQLGIPQTPFFKDLQIESIMAKNQMGFLKVIVFPLYEALNQFYESQGVLNELKIYAEANIKNWEKAHSDATAIKQVDQGKSK